MTLESFDAEKLDQLALRVMDAASRLRKMAHLARDEEVDALPLHPKKPLEWLAQFEDWINKIEGKLQTEVRRAQGARAALSMTRKRLPRR